MKKYFTIALLAGALVSYSIASALTCMNSTDNIAAVEKGKKEKKSKKNKKSETTKKGCESKAGAGGCCAGAKKTS